MCHKTSHIIWENFFSLFYFLFRPGPADWKHLIENTKKPVYYFWIDHLISSYKPIIELYNDRYIIIFNDLKLYLNYFDQNWIRIGLE